jgi:hypothetical protein
MAYLYFTVHGGDYYKGTFMLRGVEEGKFILAGRNNKDEWFVGELESVQLVNEQNADDVVGALGLAVAGAALLGPVGLLAGLLRGGQKKQVVFVAKFKDGRKLLASMDSKSFLKVQALAF